MNIQDIKSDLAGMARHALDQVGDTFEHGREAIEDTAEASASKVEDILETSSSRLRTLASVVGTYASLKTLASALDFENPTRRVLRAVGLQRRPSTFSQVLTGLGIFTAGAAVGAGVALLLAPQDGRQTREQLNRRYQSLRKNAEGMVRDVETRARDAAHNVEESASNAIHNVTASTRGASSGPEEIPTSRSRTRAPGGVSHRTPR